MSQIKLLHTEYRVCSSSFKNARGQSFLVQRISDGTDIKFVKMYPVEALKEYHTELEVLTKIRQTGLCKIGFPRLVSAKTNDFRGEIMLD